MGLKQRLDDDLKKAMAAKKRAVKKQRKVW
jgi:hypothetical protein